MVPVVAGWTSAEWIKKVSTQPNNVIHPPRSGHVAFIDSNHDVYIFGGYAEEANGGGDDGGGNDVIRYPTNDLWKFDSSLKRWNCIMKNDDNDDAVSGDDDDRNDKDDDNENDNAPHVPIQPRLAAAAAYLSSSTQHKSYIFGGWDPQIPGTGGMILQDILEFTNTNNKHDDDDNNNDDDDDDDDDDDGKSSSSSPIRMKVLKDTDLGLPTSRLISVTIKNGKQILLHNHRCTDHVLLFDGKSVKKQMTTGNHHPSPRGLHAGTCVGDGTDGSNNNKLIVFGGAAQDGSMSNEVYVLNLNTWVWEGPLLPTSSTGTGSSSTVQQPSPRASPCMCTLDQNTCIVFGGAKRSETTGGLHGCNDLWLLQLNDDGTSVSWTELQSDNALSDDDDDDDTGRRRQQPPGRNAATLIELQNYNDENDDYKDENSNEDHKTLGTKYFLLSGGWYPFRLTYSEDYILKMTNKVK